MQSSTHETFTPALVKDVSFSDKVVEVETAFKSRAAAQRNIKTKWAVVCQVLAKYEVKPPHRRVNGAEAVALTDSITVYEPKPEVDESLQVILESNGAYDLRNLADNHALVKLVNTRVKGLRKFLDELMEARSLLNQSRKADEAKTEAARAEFSKAVNEYIEALEAYDATFESVASVKEYIGIVKEIADISAIAQGVKARE